MDDASRVDALLEIVDNLYAGALEPERTLTAFQAINRSLRGSAAQVIRVRRSTGQVLDSHTDQTIPQRLNDDYVRHWSAIDPRPRLLAGLPSGRAMCCHDVFDDEYVRRDPYYQEFFIPSGFRWAVGGILHADDGTSTIVANLRTPDRPRYSPADALFVKRLLPHVARAAGLRDGIAATLDAASSIDTVVARLPLPCLVVDRSHAVRALSPAAGRVLAALGARVADGRLRFDAGILQERWTAVLDRVIRSGVAASLHSRGRDGASWKVSVLPWRSLGQPRDGLEQSLHLVTFEETAAPQVGLRELAQRYRLTPAELDVLVLLRKGLRPKEIARERHSSPHTVRDQVAALLAKTGCRSQVELLALTGGAASAAQRPQSGAS